MSPCACWVQVSARSKQPRVRAIFPAGGVDLRRNRGLRRAVTKQLRRLWFRIGGELFRKIMPHFLTQQRPRRREKN